MITMATLRMRIAENETAMMRIAVAEKAHSRKQSDSDSGHDNRKKRPKRGEVNQKRGRDKKEKSKHSSSRVGRYGHASCL